MPEIVCISPVDGREVVRRATASGAEIEAAVAAARKAQAGWKRVPVAERGRILSQAVDAMLAMRSEIKELHQRLRTTSIYVTHDQIEAMTMGDKIVVMRDGRIEQLRAEREQVAWIAYGQQLARGGGGLFDGGARSVELERDHAAGLVERLVAEALHQVESIVELGLASCGELFWK